MSTVQGILSFILLLLPTGLSMLLLHNMKMYTYGFADGYYNMGINVSPLIRITEFSGKPILPSEVAIYLLVSVALLLLGRYLYQKRPLETAGNAITLGVLRPILKYCVTFCFMLLLGSSFYSSQGSSMGWAYFGYFLGSVLAYFLMEILLKKSLRVFDLPVIKGYGIYGLVVLVLIGAFHIDISGYEKRLPVLSEVESVFWDSSFYSLNKPQMVTTAQPATSYNYEFARPVPIYRDKDNIAAIYALHEKIISLKAQEEAARLSNNINTPRQTVCLVYHLKNGSRICRQYTITTDNYHDQLKPVSESREYKSLNYPIMRINPAMVKVISINGAESNKRVSLTDPAVVLQAVTALQKDVLSLSYEQMNRNLPHWAGINILLDNKKTFDMSWEKSFGHFEEFLKTIGQYKQARIIPGEDVEYALVEKAPPDKTGLEAMEAQGKYAPSRTDSYYMRELEAKPGVLKISDPSQLETCLRTYGIPSGKPITFTLCAMMAMPFAADIIKTRHRNLLRNILPGPGKTKNRGERICPSKR
jgi:ABC-2 type transport system permease protein